MSVDHRPDDYDFPVTSGPPALAPMRAWLRERLVDVPAETVADAELLATELVTNAYRHADGVLAFRMWLPDGRSVVRLEIDDGRPQLLPEVREERPRPEPGGRGLLLVKALSSAWGVRHSATRKTTWAELSFAPAPR
ncbi:ATP-binding protein [Amycolatopsis xylanica]|uniref:ATP-binding protein n=1 Tax=Amycolatopsis xylanica TaxID=589385 RepID=UPI001FE18CD1|nr:ATP-binding protein [Amycolatopsis xylanica]